jgi:predicted small secreted protein
MDRSHWLRCAAIAILAAVLTGCATWQGMKEDVRTLGRGIENVAK